MSKVIVWSLEFGLKKKELDRHLFAAHVVPTDALHVQYMLGSE